MSEPTPGNPKPSEEPGIYPGKNAPEVPVRPEAEPEMPSRHGRPGKDVPEYPVTPSREIPEIPRPQRPEIPVTPVPQHDAPPTLS